MPVYLRLAVFLATALCLGLYKDLQSYLSHLSIFLASESLNIYIPVDNRPWLEGLVLWFAFEEYGVNDGVIEVIKEFVGGTSLQMQHSGFFHVALSSWVLFDFGPRVCRVYGPFTFFFATVAGNTKLLRKLFPLSIPVSEVWQVLWAAVQWMSKRKAL